MCVPVRRSEEGMGFPGTGVRGGDVLPCQCWELKPGPPEEQSVLLTTEQPLQLKLLNFFSYIKSLWGDESYLS